VFHALQQNQVQAIAEIQLSRVRDRLADKKIALLFSSAAMEHLARVGYDPVFGARPLKRAIQQLIETPLSKKIIAGEIQDGDTVRVEPGVQGFSFESKEPVAALN
jgi:ATP-dependent Clp protease ATP-binding subunit ClpB